MKTIVTIILFFLHNSIFAEIQEKFDKEKATINEKIVYTIEWSTNDKIIFPDLDDKIYYVTINDTEIPFAKILNHNSNPNSLSVEMVFFVTGEQKIPFLISNSNKTKIESKAKIFIESSLEGTENDILDIIGPILFKGQIDYFALFLNILLFIGCVLVILSFFLLYKRYKSKKNFQDAIIHPISLPVQEKIPDYYECKLQEILEHQMIPSKKFITILVLFIKEKLELEFKKDFFHFTELELFKFLTNSFPIDTLTKDEWLYKIIHYKYSEREKYLTMDECKKDYLFWKNLIKS